MSCGIAFLPRAGCVGATPLQHCHRPLVLSRCVHVSLHRLWPSMLKSVTSRNRHAKVLVDHDPAELLTDDDVVLCIQPYLGVEGTCLSPVFVQTCLGHRPPRAPRSIWYLSCLCPLGFLRRFTHVYSVYNGRGYHSHHAMPCSLVLRRLTRTCLSFQKLAAQTKVKVSESQSQRKEVFRGTPCRRPQPLHKHFDVVLRCRVEVGLGE